MKRRVYFAALLIVIPAAASAGVIASSLFNVDAESWTGVTADPFTAGYPQALSLSVTYNAAGGNPGGHIGLLDGDGNDTFFAAPAAYRGNISAAIGGTLQFDMQYRDTLDYNGYDLVIKGGGLVLRYDGPIPPVTPTSWTTITYSLAPGAGWTVDGAGAATLADFQTVFGSTTDFWITSEFTNGVVETALLDNVILTGADAQAPEPSTWSMLALGGLALAARAIRNAKLR
jgi:hypothetical protein